MTCVVPVQNFRASPYLLPWGSSVYARVLAINDYGSSQYSDQNPETKKAVIITYASKPLQLKETVPDRTATAVGLEWLEGTDNGGSPVIDYEISSRLLPDGTYKVEKQYH